MGAQYLAAVDCGTTGAKALIFDTAGKRYGTAYAEYPCEFPATNRVEQDAERLFTACVEVLKKALEVSEVSSSEITAVSFSTQRCTVIPVDRDCRPLRAAISWQDNRSDEQCEAIRAAIGEEEFYKTTGLPVANVWTLPSIMWIRDEAPEVYAGTHKFLNPHGFLLKRFGSEAYVEDLSNASLHGLVDIVKGEWSNEFITKTGIDREKLPDLIKSGTVVGRISDTVASETGLSPGTVLVAGGGDQQCAAIGAGVIKGGLCEITLGTAGVAICSFDDPPFDPNGAIPAEIHAYPGKYICEGLQSTAGAALKWLRNVSSEAASGAEIEYQMFNELAEPVPPGSNGLVFLPYLAGAGAPQWNGNATATFHGLTQGHGLGAMARAVMEGVAMQNALILQEFENNGQPLDEIRLTGGGAGSTLWSQIQADIYGKPVYRLAEDEAALLGAAILAGVGAEVFSSIDEGVQQMVRTLESYQPDAENHAVYQKAIEAFSDIYTRLYS